MIEEPLIVADIGGTNARFARVDTVDGRVVLGAPVILATADYSSLSEAWQTVLARLGFAPRSLGLSVAGPVEDGRARLTNGTWSFDEHETAKHLQLSRVMVINDLVAMGYAIATSQGHEFSALKSGEKAPADTGTLGIVGLGTGFGLARVERWPGGFKVVAAEAGHAGFAPSDRTEFTLTEAIFNVGARPTVESLLSGDGLRHFAAALGMPSCGDTVELWTEGIAQPESVAGLAVDAFCAALGATVGDIALSQGLEGVVLVGGLMERLSRRLSSTAFLERFLAKTPMERTMRRVGVFMSAIAEPGLQGAAVAFLGAKAPLSNIC